MLMILAVGLGLSGCGPSERRVDVAAREKILLIGNGSEPRSLDPHIASGTTEHHLIMALMEGLVTDAAETDDIEPGVAEKWESNETSDVWTFHLRPTAKWSNGDPVRAQDFLFAYERLLTASMGSEYAEMLYPLKGAREFHGGKTTDFGTVGAKALDERTLQLSLVGPTAYFPKMLQHYCWYPVHPATILAHGPMASRLSKWTKPGHHVGNGAFQLKEWKFKHVIEMEPNPHYWDAARVKLKGIRFYPIDNFSTEERMFRDGQLHITESLPLDKIPTWRERGSVYREDTELSVYFYRLNTTRGPLGDARVRRALSLAVDRESLVKNVTRGGQPPAHSIVPDVAGYSGPKLAVFDPEKAKAELADAGFPGGKGFPRFTILINDVESHRVLAEAIQEMWRTTLGIDVGVQQQDWQVYINSMHKMDYDICRAGWTGDYADPMTFLDMWMTGNGQNETGWGNAEYDALIEKARRTADTAERYRILQQAETIFLGELPAIPIYYRTNTFLIDPMVRGWPPKLLNNHPYKYVDLVPEAVR